MLFCPKCSRYFPIGLSCPACGHTRAVVDAPPPPCKALWRASVPGAVASRTTLASLDGERVLIVPWGQQGRGAGGSTGGVVALALADGRELWRRPLSAPVEGGVALVETEGTVIVGVGQRGIGAGQGGLVALDLGTGDVRWQRTLGGAVRCVPVVEGVRAYATCCDGLLYCLDIRQGQEVWKARASDQPVPIPASPLLIREGGVIHAVVVGTYGRPTGNEEGNIVAFDAWGHRLWVQAAGANVRGTPAFAEGVIYVAAFRSVPSTGILVALDARTGRPLWPKPLTLPGQAPPAAGRSYSLSASPTVRQGKVYVSSLDGHLYVLEAASGNLLWAADAGAPIATAPAWNDWMLIVGANDGQVHAFDAASGVRVWAYPLGQHVLTDPLPEDGLLVVGADDGAVAVLPWHLGQYDWAAEQLEREGRFDEAGDCRALIAHFGTQPGVSNPAYQHAENDWVRAGKPEKAAELWLALDERLRAADTYRAAGHRWRMQDCERAARYYAQAAHLYFRLRRSDALNECVRGIATCLRLPLIQPQAVNVGTFVQGQAGEFTLRLVNEGQRPARGGVHLWVGGALRAPVVAEVQGSLEPGQDWNIQLGVEPTCAESILQIELAYDSGEASCSPLRGILDIPIHAAPPPQTVIVRDVGVMHVSIASTTAEGVAIRSESVGMIKSSAIEEVHVEGDVGAVTGGTVGDVEVGGDAGLVRSRGQDTDPIP